MDRDRIDGAVKTIGGRIKEAFGRLFGDEKTKREDQADQVEGKVQNAAGGIKDAMRDRS